MKGTEIDAVREEVRLQADPDPDVGRRARGLRQQGQPDQVPDARAGRRDLLEERAASGGKDDVTTWGQLGLTGDWASKPISLYGRNSASRHLRLLQGARALQRRLQGHREGAAGLGRRWCRASPRTGSASATAASATRRRACARCRWPRRTAARSSRPTAENAYSGKYPLARFLYVYVNKAPGKPLDPLIREFVKLIVSKEGQEGRRQGRLLPAPGHDRRGGAEQGPVGARSTPDALPRRGRACRIDGARPLSAPPARGRRAASSSIGWARGVVVARRHRHHRQHPRHPLRHRRSRS